jgi:acetyl esterase/lipase
VITLVSWTVVTTAATLLFVSLWIIVPPVSYFVYPLAVGSPELSPLWLLGGMAVVLITARHAPHSKMARFALVSASIASFLSLVPIVQVPSALARFDRAMAATTAEPAPLIGGDVKVTRGIIFSKADGVPLALDVYQPPRTGTFPIVMQIYGGSWQSGTPASQDWFSRHLAARGYVVVAIDYRHAPEWIWPEQIVDVRTAMYWISHEAHKFGGDSSHIVLAGQSAGAQLTMRLAYQEGPSSIRGVVNYYGPVDLAEGWRRPPRPDPANVRGILERFIGGTPALKPEHYRHASPITWVSNTSAPTLSIYGTRDHIVDARFGRMLDAALKKAGATSVLIELPWSEHSFDAAPGLGRRIALHYTERFIAWAVNR